jgi:hypothetical protein
MRRQKWQRFVDSGGMIAAGILNRGRSIGYRWTSTNAAARPVTCWVRLAPRRRCQMRDQRARVSSTVAKSVASATSWC